MNPFLQFIADNSIWFYWPCLILGWTLVTLTNKVRDRDDPLAGLSILGGLLFTISYGVWFLFSFDIETKTSLLTAGIVINIVGYTVLYINYKKEINKFIMQVLTREEFILALPILTLGLLFILN